MEPLNTNWKFVLESPRQFAPQRGTICIPIDTVTDTCFNITMSSHQYAILPMFLRFRVTCMDISRWHFWLRESHFGANCLMHYNDIIMGAMASQITVVSTICSTVCSSTDKRKHQSSASLAFVRGINRWPVNSPHKEPVTRKMFPFDDVIMWSRICIRS